MRTLEGAPRADAQADLLRADRCYHRVDDLEREAAPILDRAPVLVRALVRDVLRELVDQVAVCPVDLDAVVSGTVHRIACSLCVRLDIFFDLYMSIQCFSRRRMGLPLQGSLAGALTRDCERPRFLAVSPVAQRDIRRRDVWKVGILFSELGGNCCSSKCPKLYVDVRALRMNGVRNLFQSHQWRVVGPG